MPPTFPNVKNSFLGVFTTVPKLQPENATGKAGKQPVIFRPMSFRRTSPQVCLLCKIKQVLELLLLLLLRGNCLAGRPKANGFGELQLDLSTSMQTSISCPYPKFKLIQDTSRSPILGNQKVCQQAGSKGMPVSSATFKGSTTTTRSGQRWTQAASSTFPTLWSPSCSRSRSSCTLLATFSARMASKTSHHSTPALCWKLRAFLSSPGLE